MTSAQTPEVSAYRPRLMAQEISTIIANRTRRHCQQHAVHGDRGVAVVVDLQVPAEVVHRAVWLERDETASEYFREDQRATPGGRNRDLKGQTPACVAYADAASPTPRRKVVVRYGQLAQFRGSKGARHGQLVATLQQISKGDNTLRVGLRRHVGSTLAARYHGGARNRVRPAECARDQQVG